MFSYPLRTFLLASPHIKHYIDLPHLLFSSCLKFQKWSRQRRRTLWGALICCDFAQICHSSYLNTFGWQLFWHLSIPFIFQNSKDCISFWMFALRNVYFLSQKKIDRNGLCNFQEVFTEVEFSENNQIFPSWNTCILAFIYPFYNEC